MIERVILEGDGFGDISGYRVITVETEGHDIRSLSITNDKGNKLFSWQSMKSDPLPTPTDNKQPVNQSFQNKQNKQEFQNSNYENLLRNKCNSLRVEEADPNEIDKFFNYYKSAIDKGWKGNKFDVDTLWSRWIARIKKN